MLPYLEVAQIKKAYTYGYPIVGMYALLYEQVLDPNTRKTDFCRFAHTASLATPETNFVPAPNNDTSYSRAWVDLRKEPVVIETPDTNGRFFSIQLLDLFSETIDNLGKRLYGTEAQRFLLVGPGWTGTVPQGMTRVDCKTTLALAFLRILIGSEADLPELRRLQAGFRLLPLSEYEGKGSGQGVTEPLPPCRQDSALGFFQTLNQVLALTPMLPQDAPILEELAQLGVGPGLSTDMLERIPTEELEAAVAAAREEIDQGGLQFGEEVNYWRVALKGIGNYGTDYKQRSVVWFKGALANRPEESFYPTTFRDSQGEFLIGTNAYTLHFRKTDLPPVSQFWSLTMYRFSDGFLIPNELNRYSIGDRSEGLHYDKEGGLTIYIQSDSPRTENEKANWLPAPKETFFLTLRLYGPSEAALSGLWKPPAVEKRA